MRGYRQSGYDPYAYEQPGRPLRPFNWVQWTGVALEVVGLLVVTAFLAGAFGLVPKIMSTPMIGYAPMFLGMALINSRREPGTPVGDEQLRRNRRMLLLTILVLAVILGAAITISAFTGA